MKLDYPERPLEPVGWVALRAVYNLAGYAELDGAAFGGWCVGVEGCEGALVCHLMPFTRRVAWLAISSANSVSGCRGSGAAVGRSADRAAEGLCVISDNEYYVN